MESSLQLSIVSVLIVLASFVIATVSPVTKSSAQYFSNDVTDQMKTDLGFQELAMAVPTLSGSSNTTWRLFSVTRLPIRERIVPGLFSHPYLQVAVAFNTNAPDKADNAGRNERTKGATVEYETQGDNGEEKEGEDGNSSDHEGSSDDTGDDTNEEEGEGEEHDEGEDGEESSEEEHDEREEEEKENDGETEEDGINNEEMDEDITDDVCNWWMRHMDTLLDERNDNLAHLYDTTSGEEDNMVDWWSELVGDLFLDRYDFLEGLWKEAEGEDVPLDRMFQIVVEYFEGLYDIEQPEVDQGLNAAAAADEGEKVAVVEENKEEGKVDVNQEVSHKAELPIKRKKPEDDDQEKGHVSKALKTQVVHNKDK